MRELRKFKSAYFHAPGKIKVKNRDIIKTDKLGIVIKVNSCMICGSDLRIFKEGSKRIKKPTVIGHETSGKIIFSKLKKFKVNDKVSLGADFSKNTDFAFGYEIDGGFSEYITLNKKDIRNLKVLLEYDGPIKAPIQKDQKIANLIVLNKDETIKTLPLYASDKVVKVNFFKSLITSVNFLIWGDV